MVIHTIYIADVTCHWGAHWILRKYLSHRRYLCVCAGNTEFTKLASSSACMWLLWKPVSSSLLHMEAIAVMLFMSCWYMKQTCWDLYICFPLRIIIPLKIFQKHRRINADIQHIYQHVSVRSLLKDFQARIFV